MLIVLLFQSKGGESEQFRIDSGVRQGWILSLWLIYVYMDGVMKVKMGMGRKERDRSRDRAVQMDNLRGWIGSRMHG